LETGQFAQGGDQAKAYSGSDAGYGGVIQIKQGVGLMNPWLFHDREAPIRRERKECRHEDIFFNRLERHSKHY
jgi:hypothetical protein